MDFSLFVLDKRVLSKISENKFQVIHTFQRRIQNPVKHIRWSVLRMLVVVGSGSF